MRFGRQAHTFRASLQLPSSVPFLNRNIYPIYTASYRTKTLTLINFNHTPTLVALYAGLDFKSADTHGQLLRDPLKDRYQSCGHRSRAKITATLLTHSDLTCSSINSQRPYQEVTPSPASRMRIAQFASKKSYWRNRHAKEADRERRFEMFS